jgi:hypothetical protein
LASISSTTFVTCSRRVLALISTFLSSRYKNS